MSAIETTVIEYSGDPAVSESGLAVAQENAVAKVHHATPTLGHLNFNSIVDVLRLRVAQQPDQVAFIHLPDGESLEQRITYSELYLRACAVAAALAPTQPAGKRVLMLFEAGLDYVAALFGVFLSGGVAVPSFPPVGSRALQRLAAIAADAEPEIILTNQRFSRTRERLLTSLGEAYAQVHWIDIDDLCADDKRVYASNDDFHVGGNEGKNLALLQYTSGSTASPKGVMLTHGNLLGNCHYASSWMGGHRERVGCTWLPPYHDMGLMGGILQPIYEGFPTVILSPGHFVQRPLRWLMAMTRYHVTTSIAPNFAFDLCVDNVSEDDLALVDLSSVNEIYCGAEPVRKSTFDRFVERFSVRGFRPQAFGPCYGLAEATVFVTGKAVDAMPTFLYVDKDSLARDKVVMLSAADPKGLPLTSCGLPATGQTIRIVDPNSGRRLQEGMVGEVWVSAANTGTGYWKKSAASLETFYATLDDDTSRYMRTGDLGFQQDGELYVTGRLKDLIIVAGRNLYPQDIELHVQEVDPRIRANGVVAFSIDDGANEQIAIVAEIRRHEKFDKQALESLRISIVERVTAAFGAAPHVIHFAPMSAIPLTTSGKVQRQATKFALLNKTLPTYIDEL